MRTLLLILTGIGVVVLAILAGVPYFAKVVGPRMIQVSPPSGEPIGEFDFPRSETSRLAVKLEASLPAIAALANKEAPREMSESGPKNIHKRLQNASLAWKLVRGDIALRNNGRALTFSLPIAGAAQIAGVFNAEIVSLPVRGDAQLQGTIVGTMQPSISPDWQIEPNLTPLLKLSRADITLARVVTVSAAGTIEEAANPIIQRETKKLGPMIAEQLDFKEDLQRLWNEVHVVEKINEDPAAWLILDPHSVTVGQFDYSNPDFVGVTLGMDAESYVTNTEAAAPEPEPLPPLKVSVNSPKNDIRIPVIANVAELNNALKKETLSLNTPVGAVVRITEPEVKIGQGGNLNVSLFLEAGGGAWGRGISGRIWVEGMPIIDYEKQTLGFTKVSLTVETRQALSRTAAWLLEELLIKSIEKELRADLNDYLPELNEELQKFLKSGQLPEDIDVSVEQPEVELLDVYTVTRPSENAAPDPAIVVVLGGKGNVTVRLSDF